MAMVFITITYQNEAVAQAINGGYEGSEYCWIPIARFGSIYGNTKTSHAVVWYNEGREEIKMIWKTTPKYDSYYTENNVDFAAMVINIYINENNHFEYDDDDIEDYSYWNNYDKIDLNSIIWDGEETIDASGISSSDWVNGKVCISMIMYAHKVGDGYYTYTTEDTLYSYGIMVVSGLAIAAIVGISMGIATGSVPVGIVTGLSAGFGTSFAASLIVHHLGVAVRMIVNHNWELDKDCGFVVAWHCPLTIDSVFKKSLNINDPLVDHVDTVANPYYLTEWKYNVYVGNIRAIYFEFNGPGLGMGVVKSLVRSISVTNSDGIAVHGSSQNDQYVEIELHDFFQPTSQGIDNIFRLTEELGVIHMDFFNMGSDHFSQTPILRLQYIISIDGELATPLEEMQPFSYVTNYWDRNDEQTSPHIDDLYWNNLVQWGGSFHKKYSGFTYVASLSEQYIIIEDPLGNNHIFVINFVPPKILTTDNAGVDIEGAFIDVSPSTSIPDGKLRIGNDYDWTKDINIDSYFFDPYASSIYLIEISDFYQISGPLGELWSNNNIKMGDIMSTAAPSKSSIMDDINSLAISSDCILYHSAKSSVEDGGTIISITEDFLPIYVLHPINDDIYIKIGIDQNGFYCDLFGGNGYSAFDVDVAKSSSGRSANYGDINLLFDGSIGDYSTVGLTYFRNTKEMYSNIYWYQYQTDYNLGIFIKNGYSIPGNARLYFYDYQEFLIELNNSEIAIWQHYNYNSFHYSIFTGDVSIPNQEAIDGTISRINIQNNIGSLMQTNLGKTINNNYGTFANTNTCLYPDSSKCYDSGLRMG